MCTVSVNDRTTCEGSTLQPQHLNVGVVLVSAEGLDALPQGQQLAPHALVAGQLQRLQPTVPLLGRIRA